MIFSGSSFEALGNCRVVRVEGESYAHAVVPQYTSATTMGKSSVILVADHELGH